MTSLNLEFKLNWLNKLSEQLVTEDSDGFVELVPSLICEFLQADACRIWRRNSQQHKFTIIANSLPVQEEKIGEELSLTDQSIESFGEDHKIYLLENIQEYSSLFNDAIKVKKEIKQHQWTARVSFPIKKLDSVQQRNLGLIEVFWQQLPQVDESDKYFMTHMTHLVIVAWQKDEQDLLTTLTRIIGKITRHQEIPQIWKSLYDAVPELVDAEHWLVAQLDGDERGALQILHHTEDFLKSKIQLHQKQGIIGYALKNQKTVNISDIQHSDWADIYQEGWKDTRSEIAIPIKVDNIPIRQGTEITSGTKLIGVLNLESTRIGNFFPKHKEYLELLARFAAIMINRLEFERKLKNLRSIERKIANTQDYDRTIQIVLEGIKDILKFPWINISLINLERTHIESKHIQGIEDIENFKKMARHPLKSTDIQASIVKKGQIEVPAGDDERFDSKIFEEYGHQNLIRAFIPLIEPSTDLVIGTLEVGYSREYRQAIYEEDIQILKGFAEYLVDILELQKSGFLQGIIHEFKSPIDGILSHLDKLQRDWSQLSLNQINLKFEDMMVDSELLRYQVNQLEYFLGKSSLVNPSHEMTDIFQDVLLKIINQLKPLMSHEYGFQFNSFIYDSIAMRNIGNIYTDKVMLNQVFFNLFMNALKYSKKAPIKKIEIEVDTYNSQVRIKFKDWGMGIDPRYRNDVFRPGYRTPQAMRTAFGNGLGLAISKAIMQKLGGDLILHHCSQPTEFHVVLPRGYAQ